MSFITSYRKKDVNIDDLTNFDCSLTISRTKNDDVALITSSYDEHNVIKHLN